MEKYKGWKLVGIWASVIVGSWVFVFTLGYLLWEAVKWVL